ncbi:MAG: hypothetical protein A3G34_14610 [Candidatus Lindowbacteria bacterium RIFCSPLOWO2_12_FULL_62_27]|nr:MAG: hypothetical protein A3I06_14580 [Candidatus Lindowbacteria bacterium RIFCSPLOWO2_02_FULL_62_12]OGH63091.1 MAG: hypothetical protein A3G34_14610 [Candidatus Lindowbacteria bacterium RIFCSPLOWO2_12_FULL_62_27]
MIAADGLADISRRASAPAEAPDPCHYYLGQDRAIYGPADLMAIAGWIGEGRVTARDWIFVPSMCDWMPILEIPELAACFYSESDRPPGPPPALAVDFVRKHYSAGRLDPSDPTKPEVLEKRQWVRIPLSAVMKFSRVQQVNGNGSAQFEACTVNLSEGGLGFEWMEPLAAGEKLYVRVEFSPSVLHGSAQVVHCIQRGPAVYRIGVAFSNLPESERYKIRAHILTHLQSAARRPPA